MLIRINLLPTRQVKKREMGRQILVVFAGILFITAVGNYYWYASREEVRAQEAARIETLQRDIAGLEKTIGEVNNLKKRKEEVEKKLTVLTELRKNRSGPVRMLDALTVAIPRKVWLESFSEKGSNVKLVGSAMSHEDVAELMRGLQDVVWTPRGIGKLVEQRRDARTSRVEIQSAEAAIVELPVADIKAFFSGVELKKSTGSDQTGVKFEIGLTAKYTS